MFGQSELIDLISEEIEKAENVESRLEKAAKALVEDLSRLSSPYSNIKKSGYTHLIDSFSYRAKNGEVEVGWGKYYGPLLEKGTSKMRAHPHLEPLFKKNEEKYIQIIIG